MPQIEEKKVRLDDIRNRTISEDLSQERLRLSLESNHFPLCLCRQQKEYLCCPYADVSVSTFSLPLELIV